jgi:ribosomal protein L37AE/L43A
MSARYKNTGPLCTLSSIGGTARSGIHPIDLPPVVRVIHGEFAKSTQSIEEIKDEREVTQKLHSCPFCKRNDSLKLALTTDEEYWYVLCLHCFASGPWRSDKEMAIDNWNKAPREDQ